MARTIWRTVLVSIRLLVLTGLSFELAGQWATAQNAFDRGTPAESKGGLTGLSTYAQDKIETVNLANGNLAVHIPLVTVGGRGSAAFTVSLTYNSKLWAGQHVVEVLTPPGGPPTQIHHFATAYDDGTLTKPNLLPLGGGWSISKGPSVKVKFLQIDSVSCGGSQSAGKYKLTRVWIVLPDGSEVEMRDDLTDGAPYLDPNACTNPVIDRTRGRVWHSTDGSAISYIANTDNGIITGDLSGLVFLSDGTRLTIGNGGRCSKITDRNGNVLDFLYNSPSTGDVTYIDQLGRQVILQGGSGGASVTIKGYNGIADRTIQVNTDEIGALLRSDQQTTHNIYNSDTNIDGVHGDPDPNHIDVFPGSDIDAGLTQINAITAVSELMLLDGRRFQFRYNRFGELAEIVYPPGGISQIDYQAHGSTICEGGASLNPQLNRRVVERRNLTDGTTVDCTWKYIRAGNNVTLEAHQGNASGPLLLSEVHYFLALDAEYRTCHALNGSEGTSYEKFENAREYKVERQTGSGIVKEEPTWVQRAAVTWAGEPYVTDPNHGQEQPPNDARMTRADTTLENGKLKRIDYVYDRFNNVTQIKEYDFGQSPNPGTLLRQTDKVYFVDISLNGYCYSNLNGLDGTCGSAIPADTNAIIHMRRLLKSETIKNGSQVLEAYTEIEYDNYVNDGSHAPITTNSGMISYNGNRFALFAPSFQPRANVTATKGMISGSAPPGSGTYSIAYSQYDEAGNVVKSIDPLNHATTISYSDNFGDGTNPDGGVAGTNGPTFAFATSVTNALLHVAKTQYDYTRGVVTGVRDPNLVITRSEYQDPYDRPTRVTAAYGMAQAAKTEMSYPTATTNQTTVSTQLDATRWLANKTTYDGYGRPLTSNQAEDGNHATAASYTIFSKQVYDGLGRVKYATNPYRSTGATTDGWTRAQYDLAGRVIDVATFTGSPNTLPPAYPSTSGSGMTWTGSVVTSYASEVTTVKDQAGKQRRSIVDGLGRLKTVDEMNEYPATSVYATTTYGYDARGNLKTTTQGGQQRTFAYDFLSRLTSAANPESGTIVYTYHANGNLETRTDARNVVTTYSYDELNRLTSRTYSGGTTPAVTYGYDSATPPVPNSLGRLVSVSSSVSTYSYTSYDPLGRVLACRQTTDGHNYPMTSQYNLAGGMTSQTYPGPDGSGNGRVVQTEYDGAGRLAGVKRDATTYYAGAAASDSQNRIGYTAHGAVAKMKLGNTKWEHTNFNGRLQPEQIGLGASPEDSTILRLDYGYGISTNNGNVLSQRIVISGSPSLDVTQNYTYDELNRLKTAAEMPTGGGPQTWQQSYDYDRWGNRAVNPGSLTIPNPTLTPLLLTDFNTANNRIQKAGFGYDDSGNLKQDPTTAANGMVYDSENKMISYTRAGTTTQYFYDGDGQRVKKSDSTGTTVFVYDAASRLIAEYHTDPVPPPIGGGGTSYLTTDHLGSTRIVTKQDGSVKARYDYLPFGEEVASNWGGRGGVTGYATADSTRQKFTQKERDVESGLDYFLARYYSSAQGRFTSPDTPLTDQFPHNPQSWNLYSYTRNNPLRVPDKDGRITPWDILDIMSLAMSARDFWNEPSWGNAGWLAADLVGAALPLVPVGSIRRAKQLAVLLEGAASLKNLENATEVAAFYKLSTRGVVLATGEENVRKAVGIVDGGVVADLLTLTPANKFIISEVKAVKSVVTGTADTAHAVDQLTNTADHLLKNVPSAKISKLELVVKEGTNLGPEYQKGPGGQLLKFNSETNQFRPVRIHRKVVHVREIAPPFDPLKMK